MGKSGLVIAAFGRSGAYAAGADGSASEMVAVGGIGADGCRGAVGNNCAVLFAGGRGVEEGGECGSCIMPRYGAGRAVEESGEKEGVEGSVFGGGDTMISSNYLWEEG